MSRRRSTHTPCDTSTGAAIAFVLSLTALALSIGAGLLLWTGYPAW
jgi:hypothetical protein